MSTSALALPRRSALTLRVVDYLELTKPRIGLMVLFATAVSYYLARWGQADLSVLLHTLFGTALVAGSASALNQLWERETDGLMERTLDRPLPSGRLSGREAFLFALLTVVVGSIWLAMFVNVATVLWSLLSWVIYVLIYTPLKLRTWLNTVVGAVSGALPVCIGWSAGDGEMDLAIAALFTTLFLWQFPHFMAIAWLYRHQYRRGGYQMLTVVDPTGHRAGIQAISAALAVIPVSMLPVVFVPGTAAVVYMVAAILLGMMQLFYAVAFFSSRSEHSARLLLRASLVYLPTLLMLLAITPLI